MTQWVTIGAAARELGVSPATLRRWDRSGRLPARRHPMSGYRLYDLDAARASLEPGPRADLAELRVLATEAGWRARRLVTADAPVARAWIVERSRELAGALERALDGGAIDCAVEIALALETPMWSAGDADHQALLTRVLRAAMDAEAQPAGLPLLLLARARARWTAGDLEGARADARRARAVAPETDALARGEAEASLGIVERMLRRPDVARRHLRRAVRIHEAAGERRLVGLALGALGAVCLETGRGEAALRAFRRAAGELDAAGDRWSEAVARGSLANALHDRGQLELARCDYRRALRTFEALGDRRHRGVFAGYLALLEHEGGHHETADALYDQVCADLADLDVPRFEALFTATRAALRAPSAREAASRDLDRAEALARRAGDAAVRLAVSVCRGHIALAAGDLEEARRRLALARRDSARHLDTDDVRAAARLLAAAIERPRGWLIAEAGGRRFTCPDGALVDLERRPTLARLARVLVAQRHRRATALSAGDLFRLTWDQDIAAESAVHRVRVAVSELRAFGLPIESSGGGYALSPEIPFKEI